MIVRSWRLKVQWTFVEVNIFTFVNALMWSVQRMKCFVTPSAPVLTSLANRNLNLSLYPDPPKNEGLGTRLGGGSGHETKCTHILQVWTYSPDHLCYRQCGSRHFCDSSPSSWSPDRSHWVQAPSLPRQLDWQGSTLHGSTGGGPLLTLRTTSSLRQERWGWGGVGGGGGGGRSTITLASHPGHIEGKSDFSPLLSTWPG